MSGNSVRLLAKSGQPPIYLDEHTYDVENALEQLRQIWPSLPVELKKAARFHDFGKAATGFQSMLLGGEAWNFRHEILSAVMFRDCFPINELDWRRCYLALLTHHKNMGDTSGHISNIFICCQSGKYAQWNKKWRELNVIALRYMFSSDLSNWKFDDNTNSPADAAPEHIDELRSVFEDIDTALCRGALVAADHLASAKMDVSLLGENIALDALEQYARDYIYDWKDWTRTQQKCRIAGSAILTAPTGSGKTEAALLWALHNRENYERIFYVLPYQVSINAMAERLSRVFPAKQGEVALHQNPTVSALHSNTALAYLRNAMNDNLPQDQALAVAQQARNAARKIYAPIKVTTIYQLLNIFFGRKFFEVGLLELTNSLVIFDEIHAYDGHTLGLILVLLNCLRKLGARTFIMTATLPQTLNKTLAEAANISSANQLFSDDQRLVKEVRRCVYLHPAVNIEHLSTAIRSAVQSGKRVAVVCNTVDKAISLFEQFEELAPLLIHSRFTIGHRAQRETKENLSTSPFVIATQVIEISLDVSFDVMFTELAPIDDLLQRFGRVNRHLLRDPSQFGVCHVALGEDRGSEIIYSKEILAKTRETLLSDSQENGDGLLMTKPLDYERACAWVESVYPAGLTEDENTRMLEIREVFQECVDQLKPMLDATHVDLETNLFETVQVVPQRYFAAWQTATKEKRHIEARQYIVNVHKKVWQGAIKAAQDQGCEAYRKVPWGRGELIVALFEYDEGNQENDHKDATGLRLKQPLSRTVTIADQFVMNDDFDDDAE